MVKIKITCNGNRTVPLKKLVNFQGGLKHLSDDNFQKLKRLIIKRGFSFPVFVWNKNKIIDGHQRLSVLTTMVESGEYELAGDIPVCDIEAKTKKEAAEKLLELQSNFGEMTKDSLGDFIESFDINIEDIINDIDLPSIDIDLFTEPKDGLTDDDAVPEVPEEPIAKLGDLWVLGEHRLLCGDSTDIKQVELLMDGQKADMVFTDPPYNIDYGRSKNPRHKIRSIKNDSLDSSDWEQFCKKLFANFKNNCTGDIYMWGASSPEGMKMRLWLTELGCHWSATIIWNKQRLVLSPANYQRKYEPCFYGWFNKSSFCADRKQTEVWDFDRPHKSELHPTMKPIEICAYGIVNSSKPADVVMDLFLGSGSTLIACEKTNRKCYGMELDPHYCDVIIKRWEDYTGAKAVLKKTISLNGKNKK